ncbi:MAG TPA: hypothetical protein PK566_08570 [Pseudobacteroides sp.]|nr:hypothetical protein [Pseudobacteroides sp.]
MNIHKEKNNSAPLADSPIGKIYPDSEGSPISGVRMDPSVAYENIPELLQQYINDDGVMS